MPLSSFWQTVHKQVHPFCLRTPRLTASLTIQHVLLQRNNLQDILRYHVPIPLPLLPSYPSFSLLLPPQAFKTIAKKATDKVLAGLPPPGAADAPPEVVAALPAYFSEGRKAKVKVLVDGYLAKYAHS